MHPISLQTKDIKSLQKLEDYFECLVVDPTLEWVWRASVVCRVLIDTNRTSQARFIMWMTSLEPYPDKEGQTL